MQLAPLTETVTGWTSESVQHAWRLENQRAVMRSDVDKMDESIDLDLTIDGKNARVHVTCALSAYDTSAIVVEAPLESVPRYFIFVQRRDRGKYWELDRFCVLPEDEELEDFDNDRMTSAAFDRGAISVAMGQL